MTLLPQNLYNQWNVADPAGDEPAQASIIFDFESKTSVEALLICLCVMTRGETLGQVQIHSDARISTLDKH